MMRSTLTAIALFAATTAFAQAHRRPSTAPAVSAPTPILEEFPPKDPPGCSLPLPGPEVCRDGAPGQRTHRTPGHAGARRGPPGPFHDGRGEDLASHRRTRASGRPCPAALQFTPRIIAANHAPFTWLKHGPRRTLMPFTPCKPLALETPFTLFEFLIRPDNKLAVTGDIRYHVL